MSHEQVRERYEKGIADPKSVEHGNFVEGEWEEDDAPCDWREELPYGYAGDGVRIRRCRNCDLSLVFNLDSTDDALIESFGDKYKPCNPRYCAHEDWEVIKWPSASSVEVICVDDNINGYKDFEIGFRLTVKCYACGEESLLHVDAEAST